MSWMSVNSASISSAPHANARWYMGTRYRVPSNSRLTSMGAAVSLLTSRPPVPDRRHDRIEVTERPNCRALHGPFDGPPQDLARTNRVPDLPEEVGLAQCVSVDHRTLH